VGFKSTGCVAWIADDLTKKTQEVAAKGEFPADNVHTEKMTIKTKVDNSWTTADKDEKRKERKKVLNGLQMKAGNNKLDREGHGVTALQKSTWKHWC
jgi:hypothetical protein